MERDYSKDIEDMIKMMYSDKPSLNKAEFWLYHYSPDIEYPKHTEMGGKWLIFCDKNNIDETWEKIKTLQDKGLLGNVSKSATFLNSMRFDNYVICVYTYNSDDKEDVMRVREALRENGFTIPLKYKRDIETINKVYGTDNEFIITS